MARRILVIKLGALGDFIYALGPMAAIRAHHKDDHITLLTTAPFENLGNACGYFDAVMTHKKPKMHDMLGWIALRRKFNAAKFDRVYDLQNNDRTAIYFKLFSPKPEWVGAAKGASHRNNSPERSMGHAFYGHAQTLKIGGIDNVGLDNLSFMDKHTNIEPKNLGIKSPYVLLVAGCSPTHLEKRWPIANFRAIAAKLIRQGITPVLLGTVGEADINAQIARGIDDIINLTGKTTLFDIPILARGAVAAIGNDTGPMHMIAMTGCPFVMLFTSQTSKIEKHAPPLGENAPNAANLIAHDIGDISVNEVFEQFLKVSFK